MASDAVKQAAAELLARVHETSDAMDRADAIGWAVVVTDSAGTVLSSAVHAYGLCPTPEAALVVAGKLAALGGAEDGWDHVVVPMFSAEPYA